MTPRVTFLMAVHNGAGTVREAVESVLGQTFGDFEFLIVDDGSTDGSAAIAEGFGDARVRVVVNEKNLRLSAALNRGLSLARGEYIARMDADDICLPERAAKQVAFLDQRRDVSVVGSFVETFTAAGVGEVVKYPTDADAVGATLLFRSALAHPAVMIRKATFDRHKSQYEVVFRYAQDYALWLHCVSKGEKLANVPEVLLRYRVHAGQLSYEMDKMQEEGTVIRTRFLQEWLEVPPTENVLAIHDAISRDRFFDKEPWIVATARWLEALAGWNARRPMFGEEAFLRVLTGRFVALSRFAAANGLGVPDASATPFAKFILPGAIGDTNG